MQGVKEKIIDTATGVLIVVAFVSATYGIGRMIEVMLSTIVFPALFCVSIAILTVYKIGKSFRDFRRGDKDSHN